MWQLYRAHAMLFVCAYVGFLGYFAVTDPKDPVAALFKSSSRMDEPPPRVAVEVQPVVVAPRLAENTSVADAPVKTAESKQTLSQHEERRTRLTEIRLQATKAERPQERAQAIDQLISASPETLQTLQTVVTSDTAVRNRIRALNSLRALAGQEGARDAVISIVHMAMVDTNASVASRANEVYRELTQEPAEDK